MDMKTSSVEVPTLRIRLNKLSSDWQFARALLEDEYKCFDKASSKIITRYEFAVHLLDIHRLWCSLCPHHPGRLAGRYSRDAAVCGSAFPGLSKYERKAEVDSVEQEKGQHKGKIYVSTSTQTTDGMCGLQSDTAAIGLHAQDNQHEEDNRSSLISDTALQLGLTHLNAEQSSSMSDINIASTDSPPDTIGIKQEDCDAESIQEKNKDVAEMKERGLEGLLPNDEQFNTEMTFLVIKEEGTSEEHCDGEKGMDQSTSQQSHEEEESVTQRIGSGGKTIMDDCNQPSCSTPDEHSPKGSSQDLCDTDLRMTTHISNEPSTSTLQYDEHVTSSSSKDMSYADGELNMHSNTDPSSSAHEQNPDGGSQDLSGASVTRDKDFQIVSRSDGKQSSTRICERPHQNSDFKQRLSPKSHVKPQLQKKRFQCHLCKKAFGSNYKLLRHMSTHKRDKPFKCSICNKAFSTKDNLSWHSKTHTGEKPFSCTICKKRFTRNFDMHRHMKTHT